MTYTLSVKSAEELQEQQNLTKQEWTDLNTQMSEIHAEKRKLSAKEWQLQFQIDKADRNMHSLAYQQVVQRHLMDMPLPLNIYDLELEQDEDGDWCVSSHSQRVLINSILRSCDIIFDEVDSDAYDALIVDLEISPELIKVTPVKGVRHLRVEDVL